MPRVFFYSMTAVAAFAASASVAQTTAATEPVEMPEVCENRGDSEWISMLLCEPGQTEETLSDAGKAACGDRLPCGAWVWTKEEDLPSEPFPKRHEELSQQQVTSSTGVWVAEQSLFIAIQSD